MKALQSPEKLMQGQEDPDKVNGILSLLQDRGELLDSNQERKNLVQEDTHEKDEQISDAKRSDLYDQSSDIDSPGRDIEAHIKDELINVEQEFIFNCLMEARDGLSNRVLRANGWIITAKPGSLYENKTEKVGSTEFNCFLTVTTTPGFIITQSFLQRVKIGSSLGSKPPQWQQ